MPDTPGVKVGEHSTGGVGDEVVDGYGDSSSSLEIRWASLATATGRE